jgi:hypothetical protein
MRTPMDFALFTRWMPARQIGCQQADQVPWRPIAVNLGVSAMTVFWIVHFG